MATIEVFTGKHGTFLVQVTFENSDFMLAAEQYESIMGEVVNWREVCKTQKRAKALRGSKVSKTILKEKTHPGVKKALNGFENCSAEDELEFYEQQLADTVECRRALIKQITEISNYLASPAYSQNSEIDKEIKNLETIQKMLNSIDKEAIPKLLTILRGLEKEEKKRVIQTRRIRSSNYKDRRYGRRVKRRPDQPYKRNRDIARSNKRATQIAFA